MTDDLEIVCPFCTNARDLERRGAEWWCPVCARCWLALSAEDEELLRSAKIDPR